MTRVFAGRLAGLVASEAARLAVTRGEQPVLVICATTADSLSGPSRELVRDLRANGARTEFHVSGDADALLQSTNRLLADIPLESILTSATHHPPHLLVIDEAESLSPQEVAALRRIANGLRGSVFRVLLLVRHAAVGLRQLPIAELAELAIVWDLDGTTLQTAEPLLGPDEPSGMASTPAATTASPTRDAKPQPSRGDEPITTSVKNDKETVAATDARLRDVLSELARERAEARGFDVTTPRRALSAPAKAMVALSVLLIAGFAAYELWLREIQTGPFVYDCGLHPDRETVDVLLAQVGRSTPTRVIAEGGRFRLQVGPFTGRAAAEAAQAQVWRLGACRVVPAVAQAAKPPAGKTGG